MIEPITIRIPGDPVPQGRPRARVIAGHASVYKPAKSRKWEADARVIAGQVMGPRKPLTGCLFVSVNATLAIPTSWPEWKRLAALAGKIGPSGIPDASNILKSAEDALNGVVWIDDAQIVSVGMVKRYGKSPEVRIIVSGGFALPSQITRRPKEMDPDCGAHQ